MTSLNLYILPLPFSFSLHPILSTCDSPTFSSQTTSHLLKEHFHCNPLQQAFHAAPYPPPPTSPTYPCNTFPHPFLVCSFMGFTYHILRFIMYSIRSSWTRDKNNFSSSSEMVIIQHPTPIPSLTSHYLWVISP